MKASGGIKKQRKVTQHIGESAIRRLREQLGCSFSDMHCKTLDDFTLPEIRAIEKEYGAKVIRPEL